MNKTCPGCGKPIDKNAVLCEQCLKTIDILLKKKPHDKRTVILCWIVKNILFFDIAIALILLAIPFSLGSIIIMLGGLLATLVIWKIGNYGRR